MLQLQPGTPSYVPKALNADSVPTAALLERFGFVTQVASPNFWNVPNGNLPFSSLQWGVLCRACLDNFLQYPSSPKLIPPSRLVDQESPFIKHNPLTLQQPLLLLLIDTRRRILWFSFESTNSLNTCKSLLSNTHTSSGEDLLHQRR